MSNFNITLTKNEAQNIEKLSIEIKKIFEDEKIIMNKLLLITIQLMGL